MRKLFITLALLTLSIGTASAQSNIVRQGNTFVQQKRNTSSSTSDVKTGYQYKDSKGKVYDIYLSRNGRAYVNRTSKAGNNYKQYLGEDISRQICREMGKVYVERKSK